MTINDLLSQMHTINQAMTQPRPGTVEHSISERERTLAKAVKIGEETGELHQAVLGILSMQSSRKNTQKFNVEQEIIDVILSTLSLALHLNIDVEKALQTKLRVINKRFGIDQTS